MYWKWKKNSRAAAIILILLFALNSCWPLSKLTYVMAMSVETSMDIFLTKAYRKIKESLMKYILVSVTKCIPWKLKKLNEHKGSLQHGKLLSTPVPVLRQQEIRSWQRNTCRNWKRSKKRDFPAEFYVTVDNERVFHPPKWLILKDFMMRFNCRIMFSDQK